MDVSSAATAATAMETTSAGNSDGASAAASVTAAADSGDKLPAQAGSVPPMITVSTNVEDTTGAAPNVLWRPKPGAFTIGAGRSSSLPRLNATSRDTSRSRDSSHSRRGRGTKRQRHNGNPHPVNWGGGKQKKNRPNHPFKIEIWQQDKDGEKAPISLSTWQQMNALLCTEAAKKIRSSGPPEGGMGVKNWLQHTHPGSEQASLLPANERFGHTVLRFSSLSAQEWYRPLVDMVQGKDNTGNQVHLVQEVDSDDLRAKYSATVAYLDYETFGDNQKQRDAFFYEIIMYAIGINKSNILMEECGIASSRVIKQEGKPLQWSLGLKLVPMAESRLDKIILDERFGILPTALCPVKILKQKNTVTKEDLLAVKTKEMGINKTKETAS